MKDNNNQTLKVIFLCLCIGVLVVYGIISLTGSKKPSVKAAPISATGGTATSSASATTSTAPVAIAAVALAPAPVDPATDTSWVTDERMNGAVGEVNTGRNPFTDSLKPADSVAADTSAPPPTSKPTKQTTLPILPNKGGDMFSDTLHPMPIPPPAFALNGIITSKNGRFAAIEVDGHFYTLSEGEMIPQQEWVLEKISTHYNTVRLTKAGSKPVTLRLAGGTQK